LNSSATRTTGTWSIYRSPLGEKGLYVAADNTIAVIGPKVKENAGELVTGLPWARRLHERVARATKSSHSRTLECRSAGTPPPLAMRVWNNAIEVPGSSVARRFAFTFNFCLLTFHFRRRAAVTPA